MYTIIESCKKFEIDPRKYILETLKLSTAKKETLTPYKFALQLRSQQPAYSAGYEYTENIQTIMTVRRCEHNMKVLQQNSFF